MSRLSASERECIIGATDDEHHWRVYVDVPSRFASPLAALAHTWGVEPRHVGVGLEFDLPLKAVRFTRPRRTSERQRRAARASIQKARLALRTAVKIQAAEWVSGSPDP